MTATKQKQKLKLTAPLLIGRYLAVLLLTALASSQTAQAGVGGGFAHSPTYIARVNQESFKGQKPEEIARYLAHFSGGVVGGAVDELAAGGEKNLPLIKKLLKDKNPWIRGGAVRVLCAMYRPDDDPKAKKKAPKTPTIITPELKKIMELVGSMRNDPHPEVQAGLGKFFQSIRVENEFVHKILIAQAGDVDPSVRSKTASLVRHWIKDSKTRVRVGMEVLNRPDEVSPHSLAMASNYLWQHKDESRYAIPVIVRYLNIKAHTIRGFFTNSPYENGLKLIEYNFDDKLEKSPGVVQAVCRSIIRIPYNTYGGWMNARKTAERVMGMLSPSSAAAVKAAAAEEIKWLESLSDGEIQAVVQNKDAREQCLIRVKYLQAMGAWLAAGKPAASKPKLTHPEKKKKAPKKKPTKKKTKK
jgi:hypothetical protein